MLVGRSAVGVRLLDFPESLSLSSARARLKTNDRRVRRAANIFIPRFKTNGVFRQGRGLRKRN